MGITTTELNGLPGAVRFEIESKIVGDTYAISVTVPDLSMLPDISGAPKAFPVLYVTDADWAFPIVSSVMSGLPRWLDMLKPTEPFIVVGVGYGRELTYAGITRCRDLTPPGTPITPEVEEFAKVGWGGADRFLRFLEEELDPVIRESFPVADGRAGLFGDSYGGLFSAYALFRRSPLFDRYLIGSPGNVFPEDFLLELEERCWEGGPTLPARVHLTLGSLERTGDMASYNYITKAYDKLAERLRSRGYEGLELTTREFEGQSHVSVVSLCLLDAVDVLYGRSTPVFDERQLADLRRRFGGTHHENG